MKGVQSVSEAVEKIPCLSRGNKPQLMAADVILARYSNKNVQLQALNEVINKLKFI